MLQLLFVDTHIAVAGFIRYEFENSALPSSVVEGKFSSSAGSRSFSLVFHRAPTQNK
jgi:hypothetical protein